MKDSGLSIRAIGRELGVRPSTVSRWVHGEIRMSPQRVIQVCRLADQHRVPMPNPFALLAGPDAAKLRVVCDDWLEQ